MKATARLRFVRLSTRKARLIADQIRGLPVDRADEMLRFSRKRAATVVRKVLDSAIANAEHNEGADIDELRVRSVSVDRGPFHKRFRPRARGRADRIRKPTSHIILTVSDD